MSLVSIFLQLLQNISADVLVLKRLVRLIGIVSTSGIAPREMKVLLSMLRSPSPLSVPILQSLKAMTKSDDGIVKAAPSCFFNFNGLGSGLFSAPYNFPFAREYQLCAWVRLDCISPARNVYESPQIASLSNMHAGINIYFDQRQLCLQFIYSSSDSIVVRCEHHFIAGVWYYISIKHSRPRIALFNKDELTVSVDMEVVYQDSIKYPSNLGLLTDVSFGRNFNGQMSSIYLFSEALTPAGAELLMRLTAGKSVENNSPRAALNPDLCTLYAPDKRVVNFQSKIFSAYHPQRLKNNVVIDIYGLKHARLGRDSYIWSIASARSAMIALGGIGVLFPIFPKLFIEVDSDGGEASTPTKQITSGSRHNANDFLGTSLAEILSDKDIHRVFHPKTVAHFESDTVELSDGRPLALMLSILSRCVKSNKYFQYEMIKVGGVEMIEYVLRNLPHNSKLLKLETESCILALLQLRSCSQECLILEQSITKRLLCNFQIWSSASYIMQRDLYSVILAAMRAQPAMFLSTVGIQSLFDAITSYYLNDEIIIDDKKPSEPVIEAPSSAKPIVQKSPTSDSSPCTPLEECLTPTVTPLVSPGKRPELTKSNSFYHEVSRRMSLRDAPAVESPTLSRHSSKDRLSFRRRVSKRLSIVVEGDSMKEEMNTPPAFGNDLSDPIKEEDEEELHEAIEEVPESMTRLTSDQRRQLRGCLQSMIIVLILQGNGEKEVRPLIDFLGTCQDMVVMNEVSQLLLCLIVEDSSNKLIQILTEVCRGPEEFASFVLNRLIQQPYEALRCTGIGLLTHYYLKLHTVPTTALGFTSKRKRGTKFTKARDRFSALTEGRGIERLEACGGLAWLSRILNYYATECGEETYMALLEMLLINSNSSNQITSYYRKLFVEDGDKTRSTSTDHRHLAKRSSFYHPSYVFSTSADAGTDESRLVENPVVLTIFFEFIPHLPMGVQERVYGDLLVLLKHSEPNRDAFLNHPLWHLCLYDLVGQLILVSNTCSSTIAQNRFCELIQKWALLENENNFFNEGWVNTLDFSPPKNPVDAGNTSRPAGLMRSNAQVFAKESLSSGKKSPAISRRQSLASDGSTLDTWFDIGMKIYATLLVHAVDLKHGWKEVEKTIAQSYESIHGVSVSLAVFSHLLNELTFTMKSKYRDLQRMAKSDNEDDSVEASTILENMLSIIISMSLFTLEVHPVATLGIKSNFVEVEAMEDVYDVTASRLKVRTCQFTCTDIDHKVCIIAKDLCQNCGHSLSVHPVRRLSVDTVRESLVNTLEERYDIDVEGGISEIPESQKDEMSIPSFKNKPEGKYRWIDLRSNTLSTSSQNIASPKKYFLEELLFPLSRNFELPRGRMTVVLQLLRYFDILFWPSEERIRNVHLFKCSRDRKDKKQQHMTVYDSALRMSLFVLHGLSPFSETAERNIRRLQNLVRVVHKVPNQSHFDNWILVIVTHAIVALNRVHVALCPIFHAIGLSILTDEMYADGPLENTHLELQRQEQEDHKLEQILNTSELILKMNDIFNNVAGRQLINYINSLVYLLVVAYEVKKQFLAKVLGDRAFLAYTLLVQRNQNNTINSRATGRSRCASSMQSDGGLDTGGRVFDMQPELSGVDAAEVGEVQEDIGLREEDISFCKDTMFALRWLRDPLVRLDLSHSENVIRSIITVDNFEKECTIAFYEEIKLIKANFTEIKDVTMKLKEEMLDFQEIGDDTLDEIVMREHTRHTSKRISEEINIKTTACYWHQCLKSVDFDWSCWKSSGVEPTTTKIMRHKDIYHRRLLLLDTEYVDYSNASYYEAKLREQREYEGVPAASDNVGDTPSSQSSFLKGALALIRPKITRTDKWDDGASDISEEVEASINVTTKNDLGLFSMSSVEKRPVWSLSFQWHADERAIYTTEVSEIKTEQVLAGSLLLTNKALYFHPKKRVGGYSVQESEFKDKKWKLDKLVEIYGRRYLLQNCAIELFFADKPEVYMSFQSHSEATKFFRLLRKQNLPLLMTTNSLNPRVIYEKSPWTDLWRRRLISNLEYLMRLNVIAGRSYNDITQYPVFPWIIQDYASEVLDLSSRDTYRDLSKPIGAINESRLKEIMDRYESYDCDEIPRFMYGSHYSSAGVVLHYLIRQEPYTAMAVSLQGGRFDCPDRLFFDIAQTWNGCNTSMSDVKEQVPEMYFCPEIFLNTNNLPLGELQDDKGEINDVRLPPWASSPYEYIRIVREALESDYVSEHLNEWIDLIFGYKQTGQAAIDAKNVFYYLTYENSVDIESITDPLQREATKAQVTHFGQTPSQLLTKEHPKRLPKEECILSFCSEAHLDDLNKVRYYFPVKQFGANSAHGTVVNLVCCADRLIVFHADFTIGYYKWSSFPDGDALPFQLKSDKLKQLNSYGISTFFPMVMRPEPEPVVKRSNSITDNIFRRSASFNGEPKPKQEESFFSFLGFSGEGRNESKEVSSLELDSLNFDDHETSSTHSVGTTNRSSSHMDTVEYKEKILTPQQVLFRMDEGGQDRLITCGYFDRNLKVHALDSLKELSNLNGSHFGDITCLAMGTDGRTLITGSTDGTCKVWVIDSPAIATALLDDRSVPFIEDESDDILTVMFTLYGHDCSVTTLHYSYEHDTVISADEAGLICIHTVRNGAFIRTIHSLVGQCVTHITLSTLGYLIVSCTDSLSVFWINGQKLASVALDAW